MRDKYETRLRRKPFPSGLRVQTKGRNGFGTTQGKTGSRRPETFFRVGRREWVLQRRCGEQRRWEILHPRNPRRSPWGFDETIGSSHTGRRKVPDRSLSYGELVEPLFQSLSIPETTERVTNNKFVVRLRHTTFLRLTTSESSANPPPCRLPF